MSVLTTKVDKFVLKVETVGSNCLAVRSYYLRTMTYIVTHNMHKYTQETGEKGIMYVSG